MRTILSAAFCGIVLACSPANAQEAGLSDRQIALTLIQQDKAAYPGNCRCPEDTDRAGRNCGGRSAYSRPGGYEPLCYESDVNTEMVSRFRASIVSTR